MSLSPGLTIADGIFSGPVSVTHACPVGIALQHVAVSTAVGGYGVQDGAVAQVKETIGRDTQIPAVHNYSKKIIGYSVLNSIWRSLLRDFCVCLYFTLTSAFRLKLRPFPFAVALSRVGSKEDESFVAGEGGPCSSEGHVADVHLPVLGGLQSQTHRGQWGEC